MIMKGYILNFFLLFILFFGGCQTTYAQEGFSLPAYQKKDKIQCKLINNLVIVPVEVNGKQLSFLLDTGVNYTLLFSLTENDSLEIKNVTPVKILGLGDGGDIDALKSEKNQVKIGDAVDESHTLYVIFDERINFSPRMGIPIHGVIGYDFFKSFVVKTNYDVPSITIYDPIDYKYKRCRSCETFDLSFREKKPYVKHIIKAKEIEKEVNLLVDTGASDALWLFEEDGNLSDAPKNYFEDFLGLGLSGGVYGKRSRLSQLKLGKFTLNNVNVSYPDSTSLKNIIDSGERDGTIGSAVLKRFTVIMDYASKKMVLKKNSFYKKPFTYDMAGLTVEHDGIVPATELVEGTGKSFGLNTVQDRDTFGAVTFNLDPVFSFFLAPKYIVAEVRKDSPAALAGFQVGDELISINRKAAYKYKLQDINALFSSKSGKRIFLVVSRNGVIIKNHFVLKSMI